jgi:hypothetical protein
VSIGDDAGGDSAIEDAAVAVASQPTQHEGRPVDRAVARGAEEQDTAGPKERSGAAQQFLRLVDVRENAPHGHRVVAG